MQALGGLIKDSPPHWDLEMTSNEYTRELVTLSMMKENARSVDVDRYINLGSRNLQWLEVLNAARPENEKLRLTKPGSLRGIPIDSPSRNHPRFMREKEAEILKTLPPQMKKLLWGTAPLESHLEVSDEIYLEHARLIDHLYQSASRWRLQEPWMEYYKNRARQDVRGYYALNKLQNWRESLEQVLEQPIEEQNRLKDAVRGLCKHMISDQSECSRQVNLALQEGGGNGLRALAESFWSKAELVWTSFFDLQNPRADALWNESNPSLFLMPFLSPESSVVREFLRSNIEDEWRLNDWRLQLDFRSAGSHPFVVFVPGATPNVNGLGGSRITMDANAPLTEWDTQWTIRHEFGHVLGFPDCYVEFYDTVEDAMVAYQLDIENLMCSRKGTLKQLHFIELERKYYPRGR
jgi:hypothetical protein